MSQSGDFSISPYLLQHDSHHYGKLRKRWQKLPFRETLVTEENGKPVLAYENDASANGGSDGLYISAGVHGDECAPVWALLEWVEANQDECKSSSIPLTIFPCLNPHGLLENTRTNHRGEDLNRIFEQDGHPLIGAWQSFNKERCYRLALNLHEDYDARGIYVYQIPGIGGNFLPAETILTSCEQIIPRELRKVVDGSEFENGIRTLDEDLDKLVEERLEGGYPEALWLGKHHLSPQNSCVLTFETPSEFGLDTRVAAHRCLIEKAWQLIQ